VGSHGIYANYGGWDQLVNNLAEKKSNPIEYLIFNSTESRLVDVCPDGVKVKRLGLKASGFQGLFYDFYSILYAYWRVDTLLLLGVQGIPLLLLLGLFRKVNVVANVGGIEWERPKFSMPAKLYLKLCFYLSAKFANTVILDNPHYRTFLPLKPKADIEMIPYGGTIDNSLEINLEYVNRYPFLGKPYYLSISRALADNMVRELCESFSGKAETLVLISNFTSSDYGMTVFNTYKSINNIVLINGLYVKAELDLIRRSCKAYIHTHTLCGTAPSLVEMIIAQRPIISVEIPQNRFTLEDQGFFYKEFGEILELLRTTSSLDKYIPDDRLIAKYDWQSIVDKYEMLF
jgi:hypothetical protein